MNDVSSGVKQDVRKRETAGNGARSRAAKERSPGFQSNPVSLGEKRQALERLLASRTFSRSDQLRSFLRFVCEAEFEGRTHEINEYVLGVSALGRRSDYNPAEDSCVRTRAHELRNKLSGYYATEAPDDPICVEIQKGAYIPRFERKSEFVPEEPHLAENHAQAGIEVGEATGVSGNTRSYISALSLIAVVFIAAVAGYWTYPLHERVHAQQEERSTLTPEMAALWKPFLHDRVPLLISFESRLFFYAPSTGLVVRDYEVNEAADISKSQRLEAFQKKMGAQEMRETFDYSEAGAVNGVFLLSRFLAQQHQDANLKHSESLGWEDLHNDNIVYLGNSNLNPSIRYALRDSDFVDDENGTIRNLHPAPGEPAEFRSAMTHGEGEKYAIITVLPAQPGHSIMVLDGSGSELMWALAASVTDPVYASEIIRHLRLPSGAVPDAFQVVLEATFKSYVPIKIRYVTHRVSKVN